MLDGSRCKPGERDSEGEVAEYNLQGLNIGWLEAVWGNRSPQSSYTDRLVHVEKVL